MRALSVAFFVALAGRGACQDFDYAIGYGTVAEINGLIEAVWCVTHAIAIFVLVVSSGRMGVDLCSQFHRI